MFCGSWNLWPRHIAHPSTCVGRRWESGMPPIRMWILSESNLRTFSRIWDHSLLTLLWICHCINHLLMIFICGVSTDFRVQKSRYSLQPYSGPYINIVIFIPTIRFGDVLSLLIFTPWGPLFIADNAAYCFSKVVAVAPKRAALLDTRSVLERGGIIFLGIDERL